MATLGLDTKIVNSTVYENSGNRLKDAGVVLPTFSQLADPGTIPASIKNRLGAVDPDKADPLNLFRVHWYNAMDRKGVADTPMYVEIPQALSGVPARIIMLLGNRFPMIRAHKVLAAYGCLAPRVVTGQYDPSSHRAIWPSTGNYCRGGVSISRIMECRGVAVLPENMSRERFAWLEDWVTDPSDIIRTPGSESNVKEIYDACAELDKNPQNVIFNQFCEFGNYVAHRYCTGSAISRVFEAATKASPKARLAAYVSASGSGGTLAAGDHLKREYGSKIVAVEALECPTLLYNGFGEHNIQGIGDKHIPYVHNVMNTDFVTAISDEATDQLDVLFNTDTGRDYLADRQGISTNLLDALPDLGLSSICNLLAAIKTAKYLNLGEDDVIMTVATDGAEMYGTERDKTIEQHFGGTFDTVNAAEVWAGKLNAVTTDHLQELSHMDRQRIFNLGYYTWVEQQGVSLEDFNARLDQSFWDGMLDLVPAWDAMIEDFNGRTGVLQGL
ncbi:MAG: pyridoxal-5'-phosphate-dependent protein subunit beta [Rhodospirillales bacterium]|jgi:cysteine synthase|nr:pyridoxal-5'-phosphate-dependent protein subunit beta [Rhodospirillales bacterium]